MWPNLNTFCLFHCCRFPLRVLVSFSSLCILFRVGMYSVFNCTISGLLWMVLYLDTYLLSKVRTGSIQSQIHVVRWLSLSHSFSHFQLLGLFSLTFFLFSLKPGYFLWAMECHAAPFPNTNFPTCHLPFTLELSGLLSLFFEDGTAGPKAKWG